MTDPRARTVAIAGSMALSMSLAFAPVTMAQDDPTVPMNEILTAISDGRFADAVVPFCSDVEATALGGLGQLDEMAGVDVGFGFDIGSLLDALTVDTSGLTVSVVEQSDTTAQLNLAGVIEVGLDEDGVVALVSTMFGTEDAPMDEDAVRAMLPSLMEGMGGMFGGSLDVDQDIEVVLEDGSWQVCDDLGSLADSLFVALGGQSQDGASPEPSADTGE